MRIFQHQTQIIQNSNGHVHKAFKIVKGNSEKIMKVEGMTNKNDSSLYHILQTIRNHNLVHKKYYKIHEDDIVQLLKEGERKRDIENMKNSKKVVVVKKSKKEKKEVKNEKKEKKEKKEVKKEVKKVKSKEVKKMKKVKSKKV
jgi:hypothetical protein